MGEQVITAEQAAALKAAITAANIRASRRTWIQRLIARVSR